MPDADTSLSGRGRDAMVPERGIPFDVTRRRGTTRRDDAAALRTLPAARALDAIDWDANGAGGGPDPNPPHRSPASRFFASFPWQGSGPA